MGKRAQDRVKRRAKPEKAPRKGNGITRTPAKKAKPAAYAKPEATQMWKRLEGLKVDGKRECVEAFLRTVREAENGSYALQQGDRDMGAYLVVHERDRQGSAFVHIVPKEAHKLFKEMQAAMPDSFLGFSVLCGKSGGRPLRVSCFAVPAGEITKAMIKGKA